MINSVLLKILKLLRKLIMSPSLKMISFFNDFFKKLNKN